MTFGELIKEKKAIMNYIYDEDNFRIGIVVACKGEHREHPLVGWALFEEADIDIYTTDILGKSNFIKSNLDKMTSAFERALSSCDIDISSASQLKLDFYDGVFSISNHPYLAYEPVLTEDKKKEVFELALSRLNHNSYDFYTDFRDSDQKKCDLREDKVIIKGGYQTFSSFARQIRKATRAMEYRAYKYFKD